MHHVRSAILRRYLVGLTVIGAVVALDLLTKRWAAGTLPGQRRRIIPWLLHFTYTENSGGAFSLFQQNGVILGVIAMGAVVAFLWMLRRDAPRWELLGIAMIAGGALGNLIDRIARGDGFLDGRVIDWIQFPNFPVFNIADSAVTVGVATLIISALIQERQRHREVE